MAGGADARETVVRAEIVVREGGDLEHLVRRQVDHALGRARDRAELRGDLDREEIAAVGETDELDMFFDRPVERTVEIEDRLAPAELQSALLTQDEFDVVGVEFAERGVVLAVEGGEVAFVASAIHE